MLLKTEEGNVKFKGVWQDVDYGYLLDCIDDIYYALRFLAYPQSVILWVVETVPLTALSGDYTQPVFVKRAWPLTILSATSIGNRPYVFDWGNEHVCVGNTVGNDQFHT